MALPAQNQTPAKPAQTGPVLVRLKRGEMLFGEGESSRAMYLLQKGIIRLFKKKGDASIELDSVRAGQVLGELAFFDGNPRSASGEALTDCELIEVSGPTFQAVLGNMPDWLKILLKTVVSRLRAASNRIRQLETSSVAYDYSGKDGKKTSQARYVFLSTPDVLKTFSAILLTAFRARTQDKGPIPIRSAVVQRYAQQIAGVPMAKVTTLIDALSQMGAMSMSEDQKGCDLAVLDIDFLDAVVNYINEQNLLEPSKRQDLTLRGFFIMSLIAKHCAKLTPDSTTGLVTINLAEIQKLETPEGGKEPFRMEEIPELANLGFITAIQLKSATEVFSTLKVDLFLHSCRIQRILKLIDAANEQKRKGAR